MLSLQKMKPLCNWSEMVGQWRCTTFVSFYITASVATEALLFGTLYHYLESDCYP